MHGLPNVVRLWLEYCSAWFSECCKTVVGVL